MGVCTHRKLVKVWKNYILPWWIHLDFLRKLSEKHVYSVGRRNPAVTFFAGFIKEDTQKIAKVFPTAKYKIIAIDCTLEQKQMLQAKMEACYPKRFQYHYCIIGLPFILLKKPFYQKNHYTCSSFLARCLQEVGLDLFEKHFSLVTPRDFYVLVNTDFLY